MTSFVFAASSCSTFYAWSFKVASACALASQEMPSSVNLSCLASSAADLPPSFSWSGCCAPPSEMTTLLFLCCEPLRTRASTGWRCVASACLLCANAASESECDRTWPASASVAFLRAEARARLPLPPRPDAWLPRSGGSAAAAPEPRLTALPPPTPSLPLCLGYDGGPAGGFVGS